MGCIDLRRPSVSRPRTYNSPAARWSLRASPPSIPPANSASRGRTSAICSGVIPAREYEEARNRGRVTFILNKVLLDGCLSFPAARLLVARSVPGDVLKCWHDDDSCGDLVGGQAQF